MGDSPWRYETRETGCRPTVLELNLHTGGFVGGHWATMCAQMTESQGDMTLHSGTGSRSPFEFVLDAR